MTQQQPLTIRAAASADAAAITTLAQLDSAAVPRGRLITVWSGDRLVVALSRDTGAVIADPFVKTAHLVAMAREHALSLSAPRRVRAARPRLATFSLR